MNIKDLADREKSDLLCNLAGIPKQQLLMSSFNSPECEYIWPELYDEEFMADAWRVLNWWTEDEADRPWAQWAEFSGFWEDGFLTQLPAADAQRLWLDKILELAIEAGMIELDKETDR